MELTTFNTATQIREGISALNAFLANLAADTPEVVATSDILTLCGSLNLLIENATDPSIAEVINTANANYYTALRTALTARRDTMETSFANLQDPQG